MSHKKVPHKKHPFPSSFNGAFANSTRPVGPDLSAIKGAATNLGASIKEGGFAPRALPINALPPLAGEPRRDSVHAQEERQLAAVEQVVLHDMPDDPSARQVNALAVPVVGEGLSHLVGTPA